MVSLWAEVMTEPGLLKVLWEQTGRDARMDFGKVGRNR